MTEHRVSSTYHSSGDLRAETAVKSDKRLLLVNIRSDAVFGRPIRDFLPVKPGQFSPAEVWLDTIEKRELALRERVLRGEQRVDHVTLYT